MTVHPEKSVMQGSAALSIVPLVLAVIIAVSQPIHAMTINLNVDQSQVTPGGALNNDVWFSPWYDLNPAITLNGQDSLTLDFIFNGPGRVTGDDGYVNDNESIKIEVDGNPGAFPFPNNIVAYEYYFTGIQGTAPSIGTQSNPITNSSPSEQPVGINAETGDLTLDRSLPLVNGSFSFSDVHAKITPTSIVNPWTITRIRVGFDADDITVTSSVPVPTSLLMIVSGLAGLVGLRRRK